jgi:hypothetical protein
MKRLTHLIIIADNMLHDVSGAAWERLLTKIISFKFSFSFHKSTWVEEPIKLDSFQSSFWVEKKQWYVGYDRCTVSGLSLLYSIPYCMDTHLWYCMEGTIDTKSTRSQDLSLKNVNRFAIEKQLPIDSKFFCRLTNLHELIINESEKNSHVLTQVKQARS